MMLGLMGPLSTTGVALANTNQEKHEHTFACYEEYWLDCGNTEKGHIHTSECYKHNDNLVCGLEEGTPHQHDPEGCHLVTKVLVCGKKEHTHDETCMGSHKEEIPLAKVEDLPETGFTEDFYEDASDSVSGDIENNEETKLPDPTGFDEPIDDSDQDAASGETDYDTDQSDSGVLEEGGCTIPEHTHTESCYKQIWECRNQISLFSLASAYEGSFIAQVKSSVVATSANKLNVFRIAPAEDYESVIMPDNQTVSISGSGQTTFGEIRFTAAGTYVFNITETQGSDSSYRYDERTWKLTVIVTDDGTQMTTSGVYALENSDQQNSEQAEFVTVYTVMPQWPAKTKKLAETIMSDLTLEEKVGQLFVAHYSASGVRTAEQVKAITDKYHVGGYIVFAADLEKETKESFKKKMEDTQAPSKIPLFISVDEEGGRVTRVSKFTQFRSEPFKFPQVKYAESGFDGIRSEAIEKADLLKSIGININHAPVADVSTPEGYIYERTFGKDAAENAKFVKTYVETSEDAGMATTLKHFPGYGATSSNTHNGFAVNYKTVEELKYSDLLPFYAGMVAGSHSVMVTHNTFEKIDSQNPASLSPAIYALLRNEMGFDGVAFTDDLGMSAITNLVGANNASLRAISAGADIALTAWPEKQIPPVINAVNSGNLPLSRVEEACKRVLCWKIEMGLIDENTFISQSATDFVNEANQLKAPTSESYEAYQTVGMAIDNLEAKYAQLSNVEKLSQSVQDAYNHMIEIKTNISAGRSLSAAGWQCVDAAKAMPSANTVTLDNISQVRSQLDAFNAMYNTLSEEDKTNQYMMTIKQNYVNPVQVIIDREDNLSDTAKAYITGVNGVIPPINTLDNQILSDYRTTISNLRSLYSNMTSEEKKALSVIDAKKKFDQYNQILSDCNTVIGFVNAANNLDIESKLTIENYKVLQENYATADELLTWSVSNLDKYAFVADAIEKYDTATEIIRIEENLSEEAASYVNGVNDVNFSGEINASIIEYLTSEVSLLKDKYSKLSEQDRERIHVKEAVLKLAQIEVIVEKEANISEKAQGFIDYIGTIVYKIPFNANSFAAFRYSVNEADRLYNELSADDQSRVLVTEAKDKLERFHSVVNAELYVSDEALEFIDAVNNVQISGDKENAQAEKALINEANTLYNNLSNSDKNRLRVNNAKTKLDNATVELEKVIGYTEQVEKFLNKVNRVVVPDPITDEFLKKLYTEIGEMQVLYGQLTDEDKKLISVQRAVDTMHSLLNLVNGQEAVHYEVQYYANMSKLSSKGNEASLKKFQMINMEKDNLPQNGNKNLNATIIYYNEDGRIKTEKVLTKLYLREDYTLIDDSTVSYIDKMRQDKGFQLSEIWILKEGKVSTSENPNDWIRHIGGTGTNTEDVFYHENIQEFQIGPNYLPDAVIRLIYEEAEDDGVDIDTNFYDYDITDGKIYKDSSLTSAYKYGEVPTGVTKYVKTYAYGINSLDNCDIKSIYRRYAFGNANTGVGARFNNSNGHYNQADNDSFLGCHFGIVKGYDVQNNRIIYNSNIDVPHIFDDEEDDEVVIGKTSYENQFQLNFKRVGNTYTLRQVKHNNEAVLDNLDYFKEMRPNWNNTREIQSNAFWPLDKVPSAGGEGNDPMMGGSNNTIMYVENGTPHDFPKSDNNMDHNPYFGMKFEIPFSVPEDYVGPLEYDFFGDDDFWVFLDDKLVCDIGGVHSSVGAHIDLRQYVKEGDTSEHVLRIYYTERGASGSTCYMSYTIPSITSNPNPVDLIPLDYIAKVSKTVVGVMESDDNPDGIETGVLDNIRNFFRFEITDINDSGGVIMPSNQSCIISGNGNANFAPIRFTKPGTYKFEIREINDNLPGFIYDDDVWTMTIEVVAGDFSLYPSSIEYANSDRSIVTDDIAEFKNKMRVDGMMLPNTGGSGNLPIYFGGVFIIILGVILSKKKRLVKK